MYHPQWEIRRRDLGTRGREAEAGEEDKAAAEVQGLRTKAVLEEDEEGEDPERSQFQSPEIR